MALYAYGEDLTAAWDAEPNRRYLCLECSKPVKLRKGKNRIPHFYHIHLAPSCRLYSKSEDHLLLQLQIQALLPDRAIIERTFPSISRISDVVWEKEKIAFEIQCSTIYPKECARRIEEYESLGYKVVWILDDRIFNKRTLRPSEAFLRNHTGYYARFHRHSPSYFYDQFEIFSAQKRVKKSRHFPIHLSKPSPCPCIDLPEDWPQQLVQRKNSLYFSGDLFDKALRSTFYPANQILLQNWISLEKHFKRQHFFRNFLDLLKEPIEERLNSLLAE